MRDTHPNDHEHATHAPAHAAHERATHERYGGHSVAMFRERFWITVLLTVPTLTRSTMIQQWFRFNAPVFPGSAYLPAIFGTAVYLYGGSMFLAGAVDELRHRLPGMMTLISLAITVAFLFGFGVTIGYPGEALWWELATLVTIMLLGHWIEMRSICQAVGDPGCPFVPGVYFTAVGGPMRIPAIRSAFFVVAWLCAVPALAAPCDSLAALALKDAKVTTAQVVPAGQFSPPGERPEGAANPYRTLPAFCRVAATLTPTTDSDIKVEVWLPASGWNGKFQAVGNGGWAGVISYAAMADAVRTGYASASTDTGHVGGRGTFALDHPEKLIDFAWRSEHEMTVKAKAVIQAFYGNAPKLSYWNGCSTGGRQGLKEAQMFPEDYDGIIAGAPANRTAISLWIAHAVLKDPASYIPPAKYPVIHEAALNACDARDGLKDGLIDDPRKCTFDPKALLCKGEDGASCLTAAQVDAAKKIYSPAVNLRTGREMFASLVPGTELGWGVQARGPEPSTNIYDQYKYVVFKDPNWDWKTFNFDSDVTRGDLPENLVMNATDPNMKAFFARGGKLLLYHGWSDPNVPAVNTIKYYESVVDYMGGVSSSSNSMRLFMAPGMGHCGGGEGPNAFDKMAALERWVEQGKAPDMFIASHSTNGKVDRTRPLCPYPQVARYKGTGSIDDAANFVCSAP